jgi:hypothetical protein
VGVDGGCADEDDVLRADDFAVDERTFVSDETGKVFN